jgi:hypothetical protein
VAAPPALQNLNLAGPAGGAILDAWEDGPMADRWEFKSETYDNCNCAINCGCQFNLPSTHGYCQSAFIGHLVGGHFNDTPLAGLHWAALCKWPGEIKDGNGRRQIVIDERADAAQRSALENIISPPLRQSFLGLRLHLLGIVQDAVSADQA